MSYYNNPPAHCNNRGWHDSAWCAASASHDAWHAAAAPTPSPNQWNCREWHGPAASAQSPDQWKNVVWLSTTQSAPNPWPAGAEATHSARNSNNSWRRGMWPEKNGYKKTVQYSINQRDMLLNSIRKAKQRRDQGFLKNLQGPELQALVDNVHKHEEKLRYMDVHGIILLDGGSQVAMTLAQKMKNKELMEAEQESAKKQGWSREVGRTMQRTLEMYGYSFDNVGHGGTAASAQAEVLSAIDEEETSHSEYTVSARRFHNGAVVSIMDSNEPVDFIEDRSSPSGSGHQYQ